MSNVKKVSECFQRKYCHFLCYKHEQMELTKKKKPNVFS